MNNFYPPLSLLHIYGTDSRTFLHNMLTADVNALPLHTWIFTAHCNVQGKVLNTGFLIAHCTNNFFFSCHTSILPTLEKRLRMYILRQQVHITCDTKRLSIIPSTQPICRNDDDSLILGGACNAKIIIDQSPPDFDMSTCINLSIAIITDKTQNKFLPQMLSIDALGGLSYQKGCYIGQEVIARVRSQANVRRHLCRLTAQSQVPLIAGDTLYSGIHSAATILQSTYSGENTQALAVVQDRFLQDPLYHKPTTTKFSIHKPSYHQRTNDVSK